MLILGQSTIALIVALVSAAVTMMGWIAVHLFTSARDRKARHESSQAADRLRRLEILLKQAEAQISQFYGPVHGIINQIAAISDVKNLFQGKLSNDYFKKSELILNENYFSSYHASILQLMRDNMHLIEGITMPDSFYKYIQHSMMQNIQIKLWSNNGIDTSIVEGIGWPEQFNNDVEQGLKRAIERYDRILIELNSKPKAAIYRMR